MHLAFHGPYTMALLVGRYLNTLRTVVYEWDSATPGRPSYTPALVLEPGVSGGPITEILLRDAHAACQPVLLCLAEVVAVHHGMLLSQAVIQSNWATGRRTQRACRPEPQART
ncbi:hypothetical protein [Streptomyces sp. NPDC020880]|uniref:hypothetical protein n=1 Tax=Streptomyces sp. NPDC020880 TaxID=3365098 RepID=UPI00384A6494